MQNPTTLPNQALALRLEAARRELLDLGLRNSLLNYRSTGARSIEVVDELPVQIFRLMVREKKALTFLGDSAKDRARAARNPNQLSLFESAPPVEREAFRPDFTPTNSESSGATPAPNETIPGPDAPLYNFPRPDSAEPE